MEYINLNTVLRAVPKANLDGVIISTFSLNAGRVKSIMRTSGIPSARTVILHHRHSPDPRHTQHYPTIRAYRWLRQMQRYYHFRFVLFLYHRPRPCHFVMYSRNINRFHTSGPRELVYQGTPRGLNVLCTHLANLIRANSFEANGPGMTTNRLLQLLDGVRIGPTTANDRLFVQRPHHSTIDQLRQHCRRNQPCTIDIYAPYTSDELEVCGDIADALVANAQSTIVLAQPVIEHNFEMGSVVRRRGAHPLFIFTTHNLTDASWIGSRTLEISVATNEPTAVRNRVNTRMAGGEEIGIDTTDC